MDRYCRGVPPNTDPGLTTTRMMFSPVSCEVPPSQSDGSIWALRGSILSNPYFLYFLYFERAGIPGPG